MKKVTALAILVLFTCSIAAHEFWIQPDKFLYEAGETIYLRFWVGENFEGENWNGNVRSIEKIQIRQNELQDQLTDALDETPGDSLEISLHDEGTAMVTLQTRDTSIHLSAAEFNQYLQEDGLQDIIDFREMHHETDSSANENYQRNAKTIIQVGDELDDCISSPTGMPLDIIPVNNPYDPALKDSLKFRITYNSAPLKGQLVKAWHRENNKTEIIETRTDSNGGFGVALDKSGKWMVSTIHMIRVTNKPATWQRYWGTCTWGYYR